MHFSTRRDDLKRIKVCFRASTIPIVDSLKADLNWQGINDVEGKQRFRNVGHVRNLADLSFDRPVHAGFLRIVHSLVSPNS